MASVNIDYTSRDYLGLRQSMLDYAAIAMPDWNTNSEGDFGVALIELFAYAGDILSYYGDRISQEAYLPTATQRVSLLNIAELLGYIPSNGVPATGTVTFKTDDPGPSVTVPAGTQVLTDYVDEQDGPIIFETDESVTVAGDGGEAEVTVTQGETQTLVVIGISDGQPEQSFVLPQLNVIDGTVDIFVETALGKEQWTQIQFIVDADPDDKIYIVRTDERGRTVVSFGDNLNGLIPTQGLTIWATYRIGLGSKGNLAAGTVSSILTTIVGVNIPTLVDGTPDTSAMTGGADAETIEEIRKNAPLAFRNQFRAVSLQDYEDLATNVPGVLMTHAVAGHYTSVTLYIVGPGGGDPSTALQEAVLDYFDGKALAGVSISILGPDRIPINIGEDTDGKRVVLRVKDRFSRPDVVQNVKTALQKMLAIPNISFGMHISVSDIYHTIMSVDGVDWVNVNMFARSDAAQTGTADIQFRDAEIPIPGNIIIDASGGIG